MQRKNYLIPFAITFSFCAVLLVLWRVNLLKGPASLVSSFFAPVGRTEIRFLKGKESMEKASVWTQDQKLLKDNSALRDQFATSKPSPQTLLPAKIIGAPGLIPGVSDPQFFILDQGESSGVRKGEAVVIANNMIGKITETNPTSSKVTLINSKSLSFTGQLESGALGVVRGQGELLEIGNVLSSEDIRRGSFVTTKGGEDLGGLGIPPDLIVGKIVSIEKKSSDLFQKANIQSLVNFPKLSEVFVVIK